MVSAQPPKLLSIEELVIQHGPPLAHPPFDSEHAVSYRTWLAISNFVAYHDPKLLNPLFQEIKLPEIELPDMILNHDVLPFPENIKDVITPETKAKYAHLKLNPRHYGSMQTRLLLFKNIVQAMGDPVANFRVGRNIRVNREMGALKSTLQVGAKGVLKVLGVNPAKILQKVIPDANRALNTFLDTRLIQYGPDFMDIRIEYYNKDDISPEGDHYSLGTILGGLETIAAYKQITIQALQTPFTQNQERIKHLFAIGEKGVRYISENYHYAQNNPVFLYRYTFSEQAQFLRRIGRALGDFARENLPSRITREEAHQEEANRHILAQERELDLRERREFEARIQAEKSRADAAEAKLTLEQSVTAINQVFGEMRTLAHDSKNYALALRARTCDLLKESFHELPAPLQEKYKTIFESDEALTNGLQQLKTDLSVPLTIQPLINQVHHSLDFIRYITKHTEDSLSIIENIISNERLVMAGGIPVNITEIPYEQVIKHVVNSIKPIYPQVTIQYDTPDLHILHINADERLFKIALMNLVNNAVEASLPDGKVKIDISQRVRSGKTFTIMELYQSGYLPPNIAERLNKAEKFTTKVKGNATGAAASYNIITGPHNGKLTYESLGQDREYGGKIRVVI